MSAPRKLDPGAVGLLLLLSVLWGGNAVAVKIGLADAPPLALAWMRFLLGGICVVAWTWWTRAPVSLEPGEPWPLLGLGLLFTVQLGLLNVGTMLSTAARASVLLNAYPVHMVVIAHFLVPEDRMTLAKLGSVLLGYAGIVVLSWDQLASVPESGVGVLLGDGVLSLSALLLGFRQVVLNRQLQYIHPAKVLLAQVVIGTPLFVLLSVLLEPEPSRFTARLAGSLFYQGIVIAGFNFIAHMSLLRDFRPSDLAPFAMTTPLFGVAAAAVTLGEPVTWTLGVAGLFVTAGIAVSTLLPEPPRRAARPTPQRVRPDALP